MHLVAHLRGGKQQIFAQTLTAMKRAPSWARWETEPKGRKGSGSNGKGGRDKGSFGSSKGSFYDGKGPFGREGKSGGGSDVEHSTALVGEALAAVARAAAAAGATPHGVADAVEAVAAALAATAQPREAGLARRGETHIHTQTRELMTGEPECLD